MLCRCEKSGSWPWLQYKAKRPCTAARHEAIARNDAPRRLGATARPTVQKLTIFLAAAVGCEVAQHVRRALVTFLEWRANVDSLGGAKASGIRLTIYIAKQPRSTLEPASALAPFLNLATRAGLLQLYRRGELGGGRRVSLIIVVAVVFFGFVVGRAVDIANEHATRRFVDLHRPSYSVPRSRPRIAAGDCSSNRTCDRACAYLLVLFNVDCARHSDVHGGGFGKLAPSRVRITRLPRRLRQRLIGRCGRTASSVLVRFQTETGECAAIVRGHASSQEVMHLVSFRPVKRWIAARSISRPTPSAAHQAQFLNRPLTRAATKPKPKGERRQPSIARHRQRSKAPAPPPPSP